jgi:hypothetical protein
MGCPVSIQNKLEDRRCNIPFFGFFHFDIFTQNGYIPSFREYNTIIKIEEYAYEG